LSHDYSCLFNKKYVSECSPFQYRCRCGAVKCIDIERINDNYPDCDDGSDEFGFQHTDQLSYACTEQQLEVSDSVPISFAPPLIPCTASVKLRCKANSNEICIMILGKPTCACRRGFTRIRGRTDCLPTEPVYVWAAASTNAEQGQKRPYLSRDFTLRSERLCRRRDNRSCISENEICATKHGMLSCTCKAGYVRNPSNESCQIHEVHSLLCACQGLQNECEKSSTNDCDVNALCIDNPLSYECLCKEGYLDTSPLPHSLPGRSCIPLQFKCKDENGSACDSNAECLHILGSFICRCKPGFYDASPDKLSNPGKACIEGKVISRQMLYVFVADDYAIRY
uniref:EGF-like domain-containing protein n=1 Tax=Soboliphyme baturini TaxID=241478 RepID=A0A183ITS3_9BILA